jgi:hypothetical protein
MTKKKGWAGLRPQRKPTDTELKKAMRAQKRKEHQEKAAEGDSMTAGQQKLSRYALLKERLQQSRLDLEK